MSHSLMGYEWHWYSHRAKLFVYFEGDLVCATLCLIHYTPMPFLILFSFLIMSFHIVKDNIYMSVYLSHLLFKEWEF